MTAFLFPVFNWFAANKWAQYLTIVGLLYAIWRAWLASDRSRVRKEATRKADARNAEQTRQTIEAIEDASDDFTDTARRLRARKPVTSDSGELSDERADRLPSYHLRD